MLERFEPHTALASLGSEERIRGVYRIERLVRSQALGADGWEIVLSDATGVLRAYAWPASVTLRVSPDSGSLALVECMTHELNGQLVAEVRSLDVLVADELLH